MRGHQYLWVIVFLFYISLADGCSPYYTWGYAPVIRPDATSAYIHAVMARNAHEYEKALFYYDLALDHTWSSSVQQERDAVAAELRRLK